MDTPVLTSKEVLKDAIEKHNLTKLKDYDEETLISLICYAKHIGVNEGFMEAKEMGKDTK